MLVQVVFAVIAPRQVVPNLVAGAIAEAGANQAGDMMQVRCPLLARFLLVSQMADQGVRSCWGILVHMSTADDGLHEMQLQLCTFPEDAMLSE